MAPLSVLNCQEKKVKPMEPAKPAIRILLADDQRLMLDGLSIQLEQADDFTVVGQVEDGLAAVEAYAQLRARCCVDGCSHAGMNGVEATRRICQRWPAAR